MGPCGERLLAQREGEQRTVARVIEVESRDGRRPFDPMTQRVPVHTERLRSGVHDRGGTERAQCVGELAAVGGVVSLQCSEPRLGRGPECEVGGDSARRVARDVRAAAGCQGAEQAEHAGRGAGDIGEPARRAGGQGQRGGECGHERVDVLGGDQRHPGRGVGGGRVDQAPLPAYDGQGALDRRPVGATDADQGDVAGRVDPGRGQRRPRVERLAGQHGAEHGRPEGDLRTG